MNIFGIGLPEMALIFVLALLVFGPKKLPEIGRSLGKAIRGFQEASKDFEEEFKREADQLDRSVRQPMKASLESTPKAIRPQEAEEAEEAEVIEAEESQGVDVATTSEPSAS